MNTQDPKVIPISQNRFDGGIRSDPRDVTKNGCTMCVNFDIFTLPKQLIPYRDSESGDSSASTSQKQSFETAQWLTNDFRLFSLGVVSGGGLAEILMKKLLTGGTQDLSDATWETPIHNQSSSGTTDFNLFRYYQTTRKIYGAAGGTHIWSFDTTGVSAFNDSEVSISYTRIRQGVVHSQDDILYIPYDNKIASNNNGSWNTTAITVPSNFYISSVAEFGTYLALFCSPLYGVGHSRMYLWDRNSSNTTFSENVDWGEGSVLGGVEYEGYLIGISLIGNDSTRLQSKIAFKYYNSTKSTGAVPIETLVSDIDYNFVTLLSTIQKADNRVYFGASIKMGGTIREGVWSIGISGKSFAITLERTPFNDTALGVGGALKGFYVVGEYFFISSVPAGGDYQLAKTNDQPSYTATSYFESFIFNLGDPSYSKDLTGVTTLFAPLPTAGTVTSRFKVDGDTSFTGISTQTTDGALSKSSVNQELNNNATFPRDHKEIMLRIESKGGAIITGFSLQEEVYNKRDY